METMRLAAKGFRSRLKRCWDDERGAGYREGRSRRARRTGDRWNCCEKPWSVAYYSTLTPNTVAKGSTWSKAGNRLNGDYIPTSGKRGDLHDLMDATAAGVGMKAAERAAFVPWSPARRAVNRIPYTPGAAGYGAGSYGLNQAGGGGC